MKRYILTGTPGSGKTSIIQWIEKEGHTAIHESATDIISAAQRRGIPKPWHDPRFIDDIIQCQRHRQMDAAPLGGIQFYDRSPLCTYALSVYLGVAPSDLLKAEIDRISTDVIYEPSVFFIDHLGFIENTDARQICFAQALTFQKIHIDTYKKFGYTLVHVVPNSIPKRAAFIIQNVLRHKETNG